MEETGCSLRGAACLCYSLEEMKLRSRQLHILRIAAFLLTLFLAAGAFDAVERAKEQARLIGTTAQERAENATGAPLSAEALHAGQMRLMQYVEEAGGLYSGRTRETIRRITRAVRDARLTLLCLALFFFVCLAVFESRRRYACLPGIFFLPAERVIISYLHDQDGLK